MRGRSILPDTSVERSQVMKRVRVTIEVDEHFVRLLQACCQLKGLLGDKPKRRDPMCVLAVLVLGESRGATEAQVREKIPIEWRSHLEAIHSERRVREVPDEGRVAVTSRGSP